MTFTNSLSHTYYFLETLDGEEDEENNQNKEAVMASVSSENNIDLEMRSETVVGSDQKTSEDNNIEIDGETCSQNNSLR